MTRLTWLTMWLVSGDKLPLPRTPVKKTGEYVGSPTTFQRWLGLGS